MIDKPEDWSMWIITTLITALGTVIGTVVFLTKFIGNRYVIELEEQKKMFAEYKLEVKAELDELKKAVKDCQEDRFNLALQIRELKRDNPKFQ